MSETPEIHSISFRLPQPLWILLAAVVIAIAGVGMRMGLPVYMRRVVIRNIEAVGGRATTRSELQSSWEPVATSDGASEWLHEQIGDERTAAMDEVVRVDLNDRPASDATLRSVRRFPELELLWLDNTQITDACVICTGSRVCGDSTCRARGCLVAESSI